MIDCPPTYALYDPVWVRALRRSCPVWLWTLRRLAYLYHRQALLWLSLRFYAERWYVMNAAPRILIHPDGRHEMEPSVARC